MTVLVLMETSGNQRYIFSSNKLKDIVGASELVARSTTIWLNEAIAALPETQRQAVDVIMQSSGKALFLAPDEGIARTLISQVSSTALALAPGLDFFGVWVPAPDLASPETVAALLGTLHQRLEGQRTAGGSSANRYKRRSVVASCKATGVPANARVRNPLENEEEALSAATIARRNAVEDARQRFNEFADLKNVDLPEHGLAQSIDLFEPTDRLALIHIDTNGLGTRLSTAAGLRALGDDPIAGIKRFSSGVDACARTAFRDALQTISQTTTNRRELKLVPIVIGGDDTTLVCRGTDAFDFVGQYLKYFEQATLTHDDVGGRIGAPLTSSAGVVWIKSGYPLSLAMDLANDLCNKAKRGIQAAKFPVSAWEFHDVHDSVALDWDSVLQELTVRGDDSILCHRPVYVRGSDPGWTAAPPAELTNREHGRLGKQVDVCLAALKRKGSLTTAQLYSLREALFFGADSADAQLRLVESDDRCGPQPGLHGDPGSLFFAGVPKTTALLDAMSIARNRAKGAS